MIIDLPDFDEMMDIIDRMYVLAKKKGELDVTLEINEADITKEAKTNPKYFDAKGNPQAQNTIDSLYKYTGFEKELVPLRKEVKDIDAELNYLKAKLDFYKMLVDVWRTQAANERNLSS